MPHVLLSIFPDIFIYHRKSKIVVFHFTHEPGAMRALCKVIATHGILECHGGFTLKEGFQIRYVSVVSFVFYHKWGLTQIGCKGVLE